MGKQESIWLRWGVPSIFLAAVIGGGYLLFGLRSDRSTTIGPDKPGHSDDPRSPADPRLAYFGPYRNIHPDVKYVGDEACALCHDDKAESFRRHPMGQSLFPIADAPLQPPIDADHHNPFFGLSMNLRVERTESRTRHHVYHSDASGSPAYDFPIDVRYAIGSGW